jgi:hypothetical protein
MLKNTATGVAFLWCFSVFAEESESTIQGKLSIKENVLFLNEKEIQPKVQGDFSLSFARNLAYKNGNAVLLLNNSGGTACPVQYRWVILTPKSIKQTPEFGSCSDLPKVIIKNKKLIVILPDFKSAPKSVVIYDGGKITENGKQLK